MTYPLSTTRRGTPGTAVPGTRAGSWHDIAFASTRDFPHRGKSRSSRRARCYQGALAARCGAQATSRHPALVSVQAVSGVPIESLVQPLSYLGRHRETATGIVSERLRLFRALTSRVKVQGETENFREVLTPEIFRGVTRTLTRRSARKSRSQPPVHIKTFLLKPCSAETGGGTERGNNAGGR